jgi:predicted permease
MPASFDFPADVAFWVAAGGDIPGDAFLPDPVPVMRDVWYHDAVGRLASGASLEGATSELNAIAAGLAQTFPEQDAGLSVRLVPLQDELVGGVGRTLWLLLGATGLVLLVACTNAANLLLARGVARGGELALRAALGAGRARLFAHAVAEAVVIAAAGGVVGAGMAAAAVAFLRPRVAGVLPRGAAISLDGSILVYAALAAGATAILFGALPARVAVRAAGAARRGAGGTPATGHRLLGDALVAAEIAMAVVLVLGAGLLLRSVARVAAVDLGFEAEGLTVAWVGLPGARDRSSEERVAFYGDVGERLRSLPGVRGVAWAQTSPVHGGAGAGLRIEGAPLSPGEDPPDTRWNVVSRDYFDVAGIPLRAGRAFTASDDAGAPPVAVVNETLARRILGSEAPIGRRINTGLDGREPDGSWRWVTVVGVVADTRNQGPTGTVVPMMYRPMGQAALRAGRMMALVRGGVGDGPAPLLRRAVWSVDADAPVSGIAPGTALAGAFAGERGLVLSLLGAFAALALGLGAVGAYGVTSFAVSRRTRELGVRMALGARRGRVSAMVLRDALGPVGVGVLVGSAGGAALSGLLGALLFEIAPLDPPTFLAVPAVLLAVSLAAVWIPARRAARVDPVVSLRAE